MKIYLVQHGQALSKDEDPGRPLSPEGRKAVQVMAVHLNDRHILPGRIYHSGKMRARQTAEILNESLAVVEEPVPIDGINPVDDAGAFADKTLPKLKAGAMLVGHLPFMANLVSCLVTGSQEPHIVAYRPGSVVCMVKDEQGQWYVAWMLRPDCV